MKARQVIRIWVAAMLVTLACAFSVTPAHADAESGVCSGGGYHLASYTDHKAGYNLFGALLYRVTMVKRWCYNYNKHRVGTVYHHVSVTFGTGLADSWKREKNSDSDNYYSDLGPTGTHHPNYPRWAHVSKVTVHLKHCAFGGAPCINDVYVKMGITGYSDGSKTVVP